MGKYDNVPTIRLNDPKYNKKRAGQPRWTGGKTGKGKRMLTCWYTYGTFKSWASEQLVQRLRDDGEIPKTRKRVLVERAYSVYYAEGFFYKAHRCRNPERSGEYAGFEPINGTIWTCRPDYQAKYGLPDASIVLIDGLPVCVRIDDEAFNVTNDSWPTMEAFLGLDESYKRKERR